MRSENFVPAVAITLCIVACTIAVAFTSFPFWKIRNASLPLATSIGMFVVALSLGLYLKIGRPDIVMRATQDRTGPSSREIIPALIIRSRANPTNSGNWVSLARSYMKADDYHDAILAFRRAVDLMQQGVPPNIAVDYGQSLVADSGGIVTDEAYAVFEEVYRQDRRNLAARYFIGLHLAAQGDVSGALAYWNSVLMDTPAKLKLHRILTSNIAALEMRTFVPEEMVAQLASRLKKQPHSADGWARLIRSYMVLGRPDKAQDALNSANREFKGQLEILADFQKQAGKLGDGGAP